MMGKAAAAAAAPSKRKGRPTKKRRGRPPRAAAAAPPTASPDHHRNLPLPAASHTVASRRSLRRPLRRRVDDYYDVDDLLEEEEVEEDDDEDEEEGREEMERKRRRREKKFKLLQKLPHHHHSPSPSIRVGTSNRDKVTNFSKSTRVGEGFAVAGANAVPADASSSSSSYLEEEEEEEEPKPLKKMKLDGRDHGRVGERDDDLRSDGSGSDQEEEEDEDRGKNVVQKSSASASGIMKTPCPPAATPLPDKRTLDAVLDKLQKKDTYGVYAEPVDPEELPDYHDIIEHPMDFSTVRKKLASGSYANFEQFENDVFLICTNAMQYNAPETIYYRQAHSIEELARKKFQRLRVDSEIVLKSVQQTQSNSATKGPIKKSLCKTTQEQTGSDISSAATIAPTGDACTELNAMQNCGERPLSDNGVVDDIALCENKEKAEELSAKSSPAKIGRKQLMLDENRRTTYNLSIEQAVVQSDSSLITFETEQKQLVAVGLHAEYSYARSLARFAGALGPVVWKIASNRIEKSLPTGVKFGPGWVGEYEPLPTPVLSFETHPQQQLNHSADLLCKPEFRKDKITKEELKATQYAVSKIVLPTPRKPSDSLSTGRVDRKTEPQKEQRPFSDGTPAQNLALFGFTAGSQLINADGNFQQNNGASAETLVKNHNNLKSCTDVTNQIQLSNPSFLSCTPVDTASRRPDHRSKATTSRVLEAVSGYRLSEMYKQPETVTCQPGSASSCVETGALSSGKDAGNSDGGSSRSSTSIGFIPTHHTGIASDLSADVNHEATVDDPAKLLRMMSARIPNQTISSNSFIVDTPKQVVSTMMSPSYNSNMAATAAARSWMSIGTSAEGRPVEASNLLKMQGGAISLRNLATESLNSVPQFHEGDKERPMPRVLQLPSQTTGENYCVQDKGLAVFPQFIAMNLSKFHGQTPWRGQVPPNQKRDTCPPDLNISFHSPGSPVRQSSGILVDSQQPDLALQL